MKPKWIFMVLAGLMILSIFSTSQGADKFYFGSYGGIERAYMLKDSLKFNIIEGQINSSNIDSLADGSLRGIVHAVGDSGPTDWAWKSHYTLWEAEGLLGSWVNLQYADWGTLVNDASASGGKAMRFIGPGTPDTIQRGPSYYQELGDTANPIKYTAEFRLKYLLYTPRGAMGSGPPTPVCRIMVVDTVHHSILKDRILYIRDFSGGGGGYQRFKLENYTVPASNEIEFQIEWFGQMGSLYIDYVKVYDQNGEVLMSGQKDQDIIDYVSQSWVTTLNAEGDTVVYRWYGRDEPPSIDLYMPHKYIDSLLGEVSTERVGMQVYNLLSKPDQVFDGKRR